MYVMTIEHETEFVVTINSVYTLPSSSVSSLPTYNFFKYVVGALIGVNIRLKY